MCEVSKEVPTQAFLGLEGDVSRMGKFTEGLSLSRHRFLVLCIVAMTLSQFSAAGCGGQNNARSSGEAFIKASPNPVAARGESGKTTISWSTGEDGEGGQVYVSADGKQEELFAEGKEGPQEAPWIAQGKEYEFRLYAGTEHKKLLDSVKVTRSEEDSPAAVSDQEAQSMSDEAFIKASPNPVAAG